MTVQLDPIWTLVAALLAIQLGKRINAKIVWLERGNIPPAVTAGLFVSLILAILRGKGWLDVRFHTGPRDVLLLVFFASLGFGAHLRQLASAGKGALAGAGGCDAQAHSSVSSGEKNDVNLNGGTNARSLPASSRNEGRIRVPVSGRPN